MGLPDSLYDVFFNVGSQYNDDPTTSTVGLSGLITATLQGESISKFTVQDIAGTPVFSGQTQVAKGLRNAAGITTQPVSDDLYFEVRHPTTAATQPQPHANRGRRSQEEGKELISLETRPFRV